MKELKKTWPEMKALCAQRKLKLQYEDLDRGENTDAYFIWAVEGNVHYKCLIEKDTDDATDFESECKGMANQEIIPKNSDGRTILMTTSRPMNATTCFASAGDDLEIGIIGEGTRLTYDFENDEYLVAAPSGYKRKQTDFGFMDSVWLKEGTVYFHNTMKNSYVDLFVVCPSGQYYLKNDGSPGLATVDLPIEHFAIKQPIQGDCPMGDEFNTESCSQEIPSDYFFRMEVTVPEADDVSNGYISLELYRERTIVLI